MGSLRRTITLLAAPVCLWGSLTVRVENPAGAIDARVVRGAEARMRASSPDRAIRDGDIEIIREEGRTTIRVSPRDGARIDVRVSLPYGYYLQASTKSGRIRVEGMIRRAELATATGDLHLKAPWRYTRLALLCAERPGKFEKPGKLKLRVGTRTQAEPEVGWRLTDKLPDTAVVYGRIIARAERPGKGVLEEMDVPADAPVKPPALAAEIIEKILDRREKSARKARHSRRNPPAEPPAEEPVVIEGGIARFRGEVRMVTLAVAVYDRDGHPLTDLKPEDFEVYEDGVLQTIAHAASEEEPFNLALLLDLSGSTRRDRRAMMEAAKRFLDITRPQDKVAIYALAGSMFQVVTPLTGDRDRLYQVIDQMPDVSGASPIYDAIVLAYAEEFQDRPQERNALIVITDGVDNRIHDTGVPSRVSAKKLRRAAQSMNVLIYPVLLDPFRLVPAPEWAVRARQALTKLAQTTGGRLFPAHSIRDLDPVYDLVADELRSVYTLAYYPTDQNFDGSWRSIEVKVKRPGAKVRTRPGYYAE